MKMILFTVISVCLCVLGTSGLAYSDSLTLQLDGIPGESKIAGQEGEIDVFSFSWQMSASNVDSGGGAGSTIVPPLIVHKRADKAVAAHAKMDLLHLRVSSVGADCPGIGRLSPVFGQDIPVDAALSDHSVHKTTPVNPTRQP
jgi:hypothetical protein